MNPGERENSIVSCRTSLYSDHGQETDLCVYRTGCTNRNFLSNSGNAERVRKKSAALSLKIREPGPEDFDSENRQLHPVSLPGDHSRSIPQ